MAKKKDWPKAAVVQVLLRYELPEIVLLRRNLAEFIVAVGIEVDGCTNALLGAAVTKMQLADYQAERFDLRYLLTHPSLRRWYLIDLDGNRSEYDLLPIPRTSRLIQEALPDSGLFARSHDVIAAIEAVAPSAIERFEIDGSWDLGEFSKFYGHVEDIYYIFNSMERFFDKDTPASTRDRLADSFVRPFRGGGSYLGLYDSIANDNDPSARLRVSGIQYNSPGYVQVKARQKPFDEMIQLLRAFGKNQSESVRSYHVLYKYLSSLNLLKASKEVALSESVREGIEVYSRQLADHLKNVTYDAMFAIASGNVLVTAKVLLSVHRRMEKLYAFFEQGRVKYEGLDADPLNDLENV